MTLRSFSRHSQQQGGEYWWGRVSQRVWQFMNWSPDIFRNFLGGAVCEDRVAFGHGSNILLIFSDVISLTLCLFSPHAAVTQFFLFFKHLLLSSHSWPHLGFKVLIWVQSSFQQNEQTASCPVQLFSDDRGIRIRGIRTEAYICSVHGDNINLRQGAYLVQFVGVFVCFLAGFLEKLWTDLHQR